MRYGEQVFEITVPLDDVDWSVADPLPQIVERNLELVVTAVYEASGNQPAPLERLESRCEEQMAQFSAGSFQRYRRFVADDPDFLDYFRFATPIEELGALNIGSRPARRRAGGRLEDLRAIPWVFAWMQNRHLLPAWYGAGSALHQEAARTKGLECLRDMYRNWRFFRSVVDNLQMVLVKADMRVARQYATLVSDEQERDRIFNSIETEFGLAHDTVLAITEQESVLERQPQLLASLRLRDPYLDPMSYFQVRLLRELRRLPPDHPGRAAHLQAVLRTINGIAAGLQNTG